MRRFKLFWATVLAATIQIGGSALAADGPIVITQAAALAGGVLNRSGHTEAATDLARLAGGRRSGGDLSMTAAR